MAATITASLSEQSATTNKVQFKYSASATNLPTGSTTYNPPLTQTVKNGTRVKTVVSYGAVSYSWTFTINSGSGGSATTASGTHSKDGFNAGAAVTAYGTVIVRIKKRTQTTTTKYTTEYKDGVEQPTKQEQTGSTDSGWGDEQLGTKNTSTITIYTKPAAFSWGFSSNDYIDGPSGKLTADKWNSCIDYVEKYKKWKAQSSTISGTKPSNVSSGSYITASAFNSLAAWCGSSRRVTADVDYITASYFTDLTSGLT